MARESAGGEKGGEFCIKVVEVTETVCVVVIVGMRGSSKMTVANRGW